MEAHLGSLLFHAYITAHFIAEAYKKAGAVDKEKFINALEGMVICDLQFCRERCGCGRQPGGLRGAALQRRQLAATTIGTRTATSAQARA